MKKIIADYFKTHQKEIVMALYAMNPNINSWDTINAMKYYNEMR